MKLTTAKMHKGRYSILLAFGEKREVSGLVLDNIGVHKDFITNNYTVSHIISGYGIQTFGTQKTAKLYVKGLEALGCTMFSKEGLIKMSSILRELGYALKTNTPINEEIITAMGELK